VAAFEAILGGRALARRSVEKESFQESPTSGSKESNSIFSNFDKLLPRGRC